MSYTIFTVANTLMRKALEEGTPLTHPKLQKLAYYLHGRYLADLDAPACAEQVEAWEYGPIWGGLYHALKQHGNEPIGEQDYIWEADAERDRVVYYTVPKTDTKFYDLLDQIWRTYAGYSETELSKMAHQPDSPWAKTRKLGQFFINNNDIKQHFLKEKAQVAAHA